MDWRVRSVAQLLVLGFLLAIIECGTAEQRVVCYYTNWSVYRPGTAKFSPQNINPYLCTHLIYAFGGFTKENTLKPFDKYQDIEKGGYAKFTGLKTYNKNLKTMLAVGGWNEGSTRFSPMVADPERRKEFVRNTVKFLRQNHFDGLDLDWEYPAFRDGGKPRDRDNYASLVQELREAYDRESSKTGRPRLLLSMAVPAGIEYINKGYDIPKLNKYLDFINLLSYDYHSSYEPAVNHHSPLYPLEEDNEYNFDTELTVDYTIKHLLDMGASADKIVLGIPTYGRSYTLFNEEATDIGSPADGPGEEGDATREKGYLAYYEICEALIESDEWEVVSPNSNAMGPYAYKGNQWVGYDDEAIVRLKAQYVNERGLGGIMFWSIDNDDFRGKCHDRPYPLIEAAKEAMLAGSDKTSVAEKSSKPTKTRTDSNFIGRRLPGGRRRTTEAPVSKPRPESSRKRVNSLRSRNRPNSDDEEETQVQVNGRNRGQFYGSEDEEEDVSSNSNAVRSIASGEDQEEETPTRAQNSKRPRNGQGRRRRPESNRRRSTTEASAPEPDAAHAGSNRITTPAPPTTPDPGTDFKCEDEGFFSHPRDCKKYFWCLDAGPGGLGIVAHHFTCPAGLVFNKAADSCDYPRNVVCPKANAAEGPTTRAPIIAATSRTTRISSTTRRSSTTTTTAPNEYSEEYEYYDDEDELENVPVTTTTARALQYKTISRTRPTTTSTTAAPSTTTTTQTPKTSTSRSYQAIPSRSSIAALSSIEESGEDPKVIQELIELIKKAGGIEELEKQLHLQGKGSESSGQSSSATSRADVTPATISRSLYERVLNRQAANSGTTIFRRTTLPPTTVTTEAPEKLDPQPSIQRSKPSFRNGPGQAQFEGLDDIPEVKSLRRERPQYVTINRQRPSTEAPDETSEEIVSDNSDGASSDQTSFTDPPEPKPSTQRETHGYVDIRRSRTSTARSNVLEDENEGNDRQQRRRPVTSETEIEDEDEDESKDSETSTEAVVVRRRNQFPVQEETSGTTSRYRTIQRVRSTTQAPEETASEEDAQGIESATKSSNPIADTISTASPIDKIDDEISIPETTAAIEQSVVSTTTSVPESPSTTETPITASTGLPVQNIDPSTTLLPTTAKAVEESTVVASSIPTEGASSDETVTKGSTAIPQPKPFGFQRRTRPTTTTTTATLTSTPETTTSSVSSESGRVKVPSETVRLPTLKELIGHNTIVAHDYTTTTPITLSIKILRDENAVSNSEYTKHISQTVTPTYEKEISKEEVKSTQDTGINEDVNAREEYQSNKYTTLETTRNNEYTNDVGGISHLDKSTISTTESSLPPTLPIRVLKQDKKESRRRRIKFVNIPIRILESDRPVTDLILEVPEYKLNSVLRSLLRVEIINNDSATNSNSEKSKDVNNYSQRTRYNANQNHGEDNLSTEQESNELLNEDANTNLHISSENRFTTTTPSISTVRGSRLITPVKSSNRGFYVTKSIESNTLLENVTPQMFSRGTELNNELTQRSSTKDQLSDFNDVQPTLTTDGYTTTTSYFTATREESASQQSSTTTEDLSDLNENLSTITEDSITTTKDYYNIAKEELRSGKTWPSIINTSRENLNSILADNDDVDSAEMVTRKITVIADDSSTEYFSSTTKEVNEYESTTESSFTEYFSSTTKEVNEYESTTESSSTESNTSDSEETFGLHSTEESYTTTEHSTSDPERTSTTDTETRFNTIIDDSDYYAATPSIQRTTTSRDTYFTTESSTSDLEATELSTGVNFYTESSSEPDFEKTTASEFETTSDNTEVSSTETSTSDYENTVTHDKTTEFNTEANRYTEINAIESRSGFQTSTVAPESVSDYESTTFINDDNGSVTTDSTGETIGSVSNSDSETTTLSSIDPETTTLDFTTTSSVSTDSIVSDLITTHGAFTTTADEMEADSFTTNDAATTDSEVKTTEVPSTESGGTASVTNATSAHNESATQQSEVSQSVSTMVTPESESAFSPSSNAHEITTVKKEEPVNETEEILAQAPRPFVAKQSNDLEFTSRGFYRSPTAIPGKKTVRRRVVKKRIYGIRRPLVETITDNETASNFPRLNLRERFNRNKNPRQRFVRRRIINHSTGKVVLDEIFKRDSIVLENRNKTSNSNPELIEKVEGSSEPKNTLVKKLLRHRTTYRRHPENNQTNSSIKANISSQNNSASNDVQSSSVLSTNSNQRRRIVVKRFRYRQSAASPSPSPSPPSLLAADAVGQLYTTESTVEDKLQGNKRRTSRQDYNDVTIDNLSSGSESYGRVSVHEGEELPRTESISEALLESEDEQSSGEINLFKTRANSQRKPGTLLRPSRPSTSTSSPENEESATTIPSTKAPTQVPIRRRLRPGQSSATPSSNAIAQNQATPGDGEVSKSETEDESLDQTGNAQESEVTVAAENPTSPSPSVSPGRPPFRTSVRRRIITTEAPQLTVPTTHQTIIRQRQRPKAFDKIPENQPVRPRRPAIIDYDYYDDSEDSVVGKPRLSGKLSFTTSGSIRCLDQGNFPHPSSCKKFITCARMVDGQIIGTEYTCPRRLSFDPIGGICNWSAGLGCKDS